jgi:hypothetical protein
VDAFEHAVSCQKSALSRSPDTARFRRLLCAHLTHLADTLDQLDRTEEAEAARAEANKYQVRLQSDKRHLTQPRMSYDDASRPYEGFKYNLNGYVAPTGKIVGDGLGCSAFTSVVLHRMRDGEDWLKNYDPKVYQWYGEKAAVHFGLEKAGRFASADLLEVAKTKDLIAAGKLRAGALYYFNARKDKNGHVGFVRVEANGGLRQKHYSSISKGLMTGDFREWLRVSMYRSAEVELYFVPEK